jgi:hypothetical protein
MECSDALAPFRRASLPSLGDTRPCACVRLSLAARRRPGAWSFRVWQLHASLCGRGNSGFLRFLGNPNVLMPCSWTPAGPRRQAIRRLRHGPRCSDDEGSHDKALSGLDSRAWARAVYASSLGSPQDHARLASGCLASFPGGIGYPQGSYERFPVCFLHPVLLSQACLTQRHSPMTRCGGE